MKKKTRRLVTSILNSATTVPGHSVAVSSHLPKTLCSSDPVRLHLHQSLDFRKVPGHPDKSSRVRWEAMNTFFFPCAVSRSGSRRRGHRRAGQGCWCPASPPGQEGPAQGCWAAILGLQPHLRQLSVERGPRLLKYNITHRFRCAAALVSLLRAPLYSTTLMFLLLPRFNPEALPS